MKITLSNRALEKLDLIAKASSVDAELLEAIGFAPAKALRFAQETGDVPGADVVAHLILAGGKDPPEELLQLYALTGGNLFLPADVEMTTPTRMGVAAIVANSLSASKGTVRLGIRAWRRIWARLSGGQAEADSEEIGA